MKEEIYTEQSIYRPAPSAFRRVSWGAIFAGMFVAIVVQVILTLLGASIGAATINMNETNPAEGLAIGSGIWLLVSSLIALFSGACVAGRLSGGPRRADGLIHGIVTFSVVEAAMILLLTTTVGSLLGGAGNLLANAAGNSQVTGERLEQLQSRVEQSANELMPSGGSQGASEQEMKEMGNKAASGVSKGALWAFIAMVLGLGVSAWGGWVGTGSLPRYKDPEPVRAT